MRKMIKVLARWWNAIIRRRVSAPAPRVEPTLDDVSYIDLANACSRLAHLGGRQAVDDVLARFGAVFGAWGKVPQSQLAAAVKAIEETHIAPAFEPKAKHTKHVDGRHYGAKCIYAIIMDRYEHQGIFHSGDIRDLLVSMGFAATSHGPALSDLCQLGYLESMGECYYAYIKPASKRTDWTEEGHRLHEMRDARRVTTR